LKKCKRELWNCLFANEHFNDDLAVAAPRLERWLPRTALMLDRRVAYVRHRTDCAAPRT
jgi:hypothetical protein